MGKITIKEKQLRKVVSECIKNVLSEDGLTIDRNKVYQCDSPEELKSVFFDIMINEGEYRHNTFVAEVYYKGMAMMFYTHSDGSAMLSYHDMQGFPEVKVGSNFGELCKFAITNLINI